MSVQLPAVQTQQWHWQGFPIRYQYCDARGSSDFAASEAQKVGAPVLLIHGFGASSDHWRKNLPVLGQFHRVYALDLIGFGQSAKPTPGNPLAYTFETWGQQVIDFCREVIGEPAYGVGNSIGAVVVLQAAVMQSQQILGVGLLNCSLRLLHERKRLTLPWYRRWSAPLLQKVLGIPAIAAVFFRQLATEPTVTNILRQAYGRKAAVTPELVEFILAPARDPGALAVFIAFIQYAQGPLPEDLLPQLTCPAIAIWGEADPWEPIALGRELAALGPTVEDFIALEGVGHCPQDEDPDRVNAILLQWFQRLES